MRALIISLSLICCGFISAQEVFLIHNRVIGTVEHKHQGSKTWMTVNSSTKLYSSDSLFFHPHSGLTIYSENSPRLYPFENINGKQSLSDLLEQSNKNFLVVFAKLITSKYKGDETTNKLSFSGFGMGERGEANEMVLSITEQIGEALKANRCLRLNFKSSVQKENCDNQDFYFSLKNGEPFVLYFAIFTYSQNEDKIMSLLTYPGEYMFIPPMCTLNLDSFLLKDNDDMTYIIVTAKEPIQSKEIQNTHNSNRHASTSNHIKAEINVTIL